MNEIELKILEIDSNKIQIKLLSLGATKIFEGELVWTSLDFPDGRLSKDERLLRLRREGDDTTLTYKRLLHTVEAKVSEENVIKVSDFEIAKKILEELGLKEKQGYPLTKHRIAFQLDNLHFDIDTFPNIPTLLEIEGPNIDAIYKYVELLGFTKTDTKPWGAREVFKHYRSQSK